jgi:Protein NO VEIN, C-terminal
MSAPKEVDLQTELQEKARLFVEPQLEALGLGREHLEVKTTTGPAETPFFMSASEVLYARTCKVKYMLLRLYRYGQQNGPVPFFVIESPMSDSGRLDLAPVSYRVRLK